MTKVKNAQGKQYIDKDDHYLRETVRNIGIYGYFLIMTGTKVCGLTSQNRLYYILAAVAVVLGFIGFICSSHEVKDIPRIVAICLVPIISFYFNHELPLLMLMAALVLLKDVKIDDVVKKMGMLWITVIVGAAILTLVGIIPFRTYPDEDLRIWYFGGHNTFHEAVTLAIMYYYVIRRKGNWYTAIIFGVITLWLYGQTTSDGGMLVAMLVIAGMTLWHYTKAKDVLWKVFSWLMCLGCVAITVFSFVIGIMYKAGDKMSEMWDKLFTNRVHIMRYVLDAYPITPFGHKLEGRLDYELLDNAYFDILMEFGVVTLILFVVMYVLVIRRFYVRKEYDRIIICCALFAYAVVEQLFRHCFLNFTLLYFAYIIWNKENVLDDVEDYKNTSLL